MIESKYFVTMTMDELWEIKNALEDTKVSLMDEIEKNEESPESIESMKNHLEFTKSILEKIYSIKTSNCDTKTIQIIGKVKQ